jgi:hypothetical protein
MDVVTACLNGTPEGDIILTLPEELNDGTTIKLKKVMD